MQNRQIQSAEEQVEGDLIEKMNRIRESLKRIPPGELAKLSGAEFSSGKIQLEMLFCKYKVDITDFTVTCQGKKETDISLQCLVLFYLERSDGAKAAEKWLSFRELPGGIQYHQAFQGYAPDELSKYFKNDITGYSKISHELGAENMDMSDAGFIYTVLPRIRLGLSYYTGDEDFSPKVTFLFDANVHHYMATDGLASLGARLVRLLIKKSKAKQG